MKGQFRVDSPGVRTPDPGYALWNRHVPPPGPDDGLLSHGLVLGLLRAAFLGLLLAQEIQMLDRPPESRIAHVRVDVRGRDAAMPQGSLNESQVACFLVEAGGKGMTKRMSGALFGNAGDVEPVGKSQFDLTDSNASPTVGKEKGFVVGNGSVCDMTFQKPFEWAAQEYGALRPILSADIERAVANVDIANVERHERAETDAGREHDHDHQAITPGNGRVHLLKRPKKGAYLAPGKISGDVSRTPAHTDEPCRILRDATCIDEELKEGAQGRLRPVERYGFLGPSTSRVGKRLGREESGDICGRDSREFNPVPGPPLECPKITHVHLAGERAFPVGVKLGVETPYRSRESHGESMNASR